MPTNLAQYLNLEKHHQAVNCKKHTGFFARAYRLLFHRVMSSRVSHSPCKAHKIYVLGAHFFLAILIAVLASGCGRSSNRSQESPVATEQPRVEQRFLTASASAPAPLTPKQQALRLRLEKQVADEQPTHRLALRNGRVVDGRLIEESDNGIRLREGFGFSGYVIAPYRRSEIAGIQSLPAQPVEITDEDVRLSEEFPQYRFAKIQPYTFVTDQSYGDVERVLRLLTQVRQQFELKFAPLIRKGAAPQDIRIVFFGTEKAFRAYAQRSAPALVNSAGYYSSGNNRLALLNQLGTAKFTELDERIANRARALRERTDGSGEERHQASRRLAELRSEITFEAKSMTERLIRHEGAHQLFHTYRVHSPYALEPTWLTEGLAEYCEPHEIGGYHFALASRLAKQRDSSSLLPLKTLLNHNEASGFFSLGEEAIDTAYAQSWALVYFLMQDEFRTGFFQFIKSYRDMDNSDAALAQAADPVTLLSSCLKTDFNTLEKKWQTFVNRL